MAWRGGFTGEGFTRPEFKAWLAKQPKPSWVKFMVAHNTAAPYIKPPVAPSTRIKNLGNYYKNLGWSSGPNIIVILDKVYIGTPWAYPGTNSPGFNGKGLGVEVEGDYRSGKHDPLSGDGAVAWSAASWVFAEVLAWLGLPIDDAHLKLHREDPKTTHDCPGNLVTKDWLLQKVSLAGNGSSQPANPGLGSPAGTPPKIDYKAQALKQLFDLKEIQERLKIHGFDPGPADSIMGPRTDSAIRRHQTSLTVAPTGVVGGWQMARLREGPKASPEPPLPATGQSIEQNQNVYQPIEELHPSDFAISWMKRFEGLRLVAYDDVGSWAIGYGHNANSRRAPIPFQGMTITNEKADEILAADAEAISAEVRKVLKGILLKQYQFDALVLDCFQRGQTQFTKTGVVTMLKQGREQEASAAFHYQATTSTNAGLNRRRKVEAQIFDGEKPTKW